MNGLAASGADVFGREIAIVGHPIAVGFQLPDTRPLSGCSGRITNERQWDVNLRDHTRGL